MNNRLLYERDGLPIFQNRMYETRAEALNAPQGTVRLVEDLATGLVHNIAFEPDRVVYDEHYQNEQSHSQKFSDHLEEVAGIVSANLGHKDIIEVGCGKGHFVDMMSARGADITGFDPAYEGSNPAIRKVAFGAGDQMSGEGIVLRHVLEHIANPVAFLRDIASANGNRGRIYIEVPCFQWIAENRSWFDVFYEHVNYFRLGDFRRMFGSVIESGHLFGGQYIYVVADLSSIRTPVRDPADPADLPPDFAAGLFNEAGNELPSIIWGGASKGVIYSLSRARAGHPVDAVIDINPAKQGKFLAGTGLLVEPPEAVLGRFPHGTQIAVMNNNYLTEIRQLAGDQFVCIGIDHV
jgi:hypothetical protein